VIYQQLFDRVPEPEVVRAGLIGCGSFGSVVATQARLIPRLELRVVADKNVSAARSAFLAAGVADNDITVCDSSKAALRALESGQWVIAEDAMVLMDLPLHVIVTATCVPEASARFAYEAIRHGKHVVFVDKEADSVLRPDEAVPSVEGGVFVVVANADQRAREVMIGKGLMANRAGSAMLIYRAHHLCGAETAISILCAGLLGVPTGGSTVSPVADIAVTAKRDFQAGEMVSGLGQSSTDPNLGAQMIPATPVTDDSPLPFFLLEGQRLATDWAQGTVLTRRRVVPPKDSLLWSLRQQQDELFLLGK